MRLFLGGSNGLALYEDGELTKGAHEGVLCLVRPKPGLVLAGTESGCLLRWDTNAEAEVVAKDLGEAVTALALATGGKVIAGTMPPGIWVSKDGGGSWKELPMLRSAPGCEGWSAPWGPPLVCTIAVHPKDSKTIYCGIEKGGLYRSRDGGKKWLNLTIPASDVHCIQVSPARHERVYVATGNPTGCGGFCSDDGGFTWRTMSLGTQRTYT
ncbi:MAG: WD40/YVTN/BNR-like repeat-containing protein, partial [Candidatus Methylomirabilales bacterium]